MLFFFLFLVLYLLYLNFDKVEAITIRGSMEDTGHGFTDIHGVDDDDEKRSEQVTSNGIITTRDGGFSKVHFTFTFHMDMGSMIGKNNIQVIRSSSNSNFSLSLLSLFLFFFSNG